MTTRAFQAKALIVSVFALGVISGLLVANVYEARVRGAERVKSESRGEERRQRMKTFEDSLNLTESQRAEMDRILDETRSEFRRLRAESRPQFEAIFKRSHERIRALLNPDQAARYDEFHANRARRDRSSGPRSRTPQIP